VRVFIFFTLAAIALHIESIVVIWKSIYLAAKPAAQVEVAVWWFTPGQVTGELVSCVPGSWAERSGP
jgi:hypothetical protein